MGGSSTYCANVLYTEADARFNLLCNTGVINVDAIDDKTGSKLFQVGIVNKGQDLPTSCSNGAFSDPYSCSSYVDQSAMIAEIEN